MVATYHGKQNWLFDFFDIAKFASQTSLAAGFLKSGLNRHLITPYSQEKETGFGVVFL